MSNVVSFLENVGRNAAMMQVTRAQLLQTMRREVVSDAKRMNSMLGDPGTMYCSNFPVKTPMPKKAPPKKAPVKAPPKKAPAKKPAKKAPTKRK